MRRLAGVALGFSCLAILYACSSDDDSGTTTGPDASAPVASGNSPANPTDSGGSQNPADSGDGAPDAGDSGATPASCNLSADFGAPVMLQGISTFVDQERSISLSSDELTAYFIRGGNSGQAGVAKRTSLTATFSEDFPDALNDDGPWDGISVSRDGKTLYLSKTNQIFAVAIQADGSYGAAAQVQTANTALSGEFPSLTADNGEAFFDQHSDTPDAGGLFHSLVTSSTSWAAPSTIGSAFQLGDREPVLSADGLTLYFTGRRAAASDDIYVTKRASAAGAWGGPTAVTSVNTTAVDEANWLSADGCRLYLSSTSGGNNSDLYVATRPK